jgi:parvulin-like peptidyl-prolyl isomerase
LAAAKLSPGQVSNTVTTTSGAGYYYVKLIDKNDTQLRYEYIFVPLSEFSAKLQQLRKDNKISEYISVEEASTTQPTPTQQP